MPAGLCGERAGGHGNMGKYRAQTAPSIGGSYYGCPGQQRIPGTLLFLVLSGAELLVSKAAGPAVPRGLFRASEGQQGPHPSLVRPPPLPTRWLMSRQKACWMAVRLCSSKDLNLRFSISLKVSNTTARSYKGRTRDLAPLRGGVSRSGGVPATPQGGPEKTLPPAPRI